jgi:hypothetical protein
MEEPGHFCIVDDGVEPGAVARAIDGGVLSAGAAVFMHLDLRDIPWQAAPLALRRAMLAGAWQGLAGVAVTLPEPGDDPQRQPAIWHVLRDARADAALWQHAARLSKRASEDDVLAGPAEKVLSGLDFGGNIGRGGRYSLPVVREPRAGREVLRIAKRDDPGSLVDAFAKAREDSIRALRILEKAPWEQGSRNAWWRRRPMVRDGRNVWSIMAADGEITWRAALRLQKGLSAIAGNEPDIGRTVPADLGNIEVLWIIADGAPTVAVPDAVTEALGADRRAPLMAARLGRSGVAIILRDPELVPELLTLISEEQHPLSPASDVE